MTHRTLLLVTVCFAILAAFAIGCSTLVTTDGPVPNTVITPPESEPGDGGRAPDADLARPSPAHPLGSPLCNASGWMGCYPDNPKTAIASDCNFALDAGVYSASNGNDHAQLACHVQPANGDAGVQPVCTPPGSSTGGMQCNGPTDCAPGYECVGDGVCRHYCCAGDCTNQDEFCDIQPMVADPVTKVPVCMPIDGPCRLLDPSSCNPSTETCAVVRDNGARGCVAVGSGHAGDECDTDHCAQDRVCLGPAGARRCYVLCHTTPGSTECGAKQTCKGGLPLFPMPSIGICE
jgi:hypothetical protein